MGSTVGSIYCFVIVIDGVHLNHIMLVNGVAYVLIDRLAPI